MRDHNFVAYTYPDGTQGQLSGATSGSPGYRDVVEQFFGEKAMVEISENHFRYVRSRRAVFAAAGALPAARAAQGTEAERRGPKLSVRVEPLLPKRTLAEQPERVAAAGSQGFEFGEWRA